MGSDSWATAAATYAASYASAHPYFTAEELRAAAYASGELERPHDDRRWGGVLAALERSGVIAKLGYAKALTRHGAPTVQWGSLVFDRNAILRKNEWLRLAQNYVRMYIAARHGAGILTEGVKDHAIQLGCNRPEYEQWWDEVIAAQGYEKAGEQWEKQACCAECKEGF